MGAALRRLPDGVYEGEDILDCDALDDSEEYRVRVSISVRDGRAEIDFSGTSRQARTSVNAGWLDTKSGVAIALMFLLAPNSSFTSGTLRDVDILLPEGTFVSARPPEGVIFLFFEAVPVILSAIFRALAPALGERAVGGDFGTISLHSANGTHPDGRPWVTMAQLGGEHGPWAATAAGDGDSYTVYYAANNMDPPTEAIEADVPAVVLRKEYATDTGGPGRHRGGASVLHDTLYLEEAEHFSMPLRFKTPSGFGVHGGGPGGGGGVWMWSGRDAVEAARNAPGLEPEAYADSTPVAGRLDPERHTTSPDGTFFSFARVPVWNTTPGALFRYLTNGGGGWGDPLDREPADVLRDVRDEYVSREGAERDYGVVVHGDPHHDPEGLVLDETATARARERLRAERAAPGDGTGP
jgi:N-methylhydantoinase B